MRFLGALATVTIGLVVGIVACSSSDDAGSSPTEAGADSPTTEAAAPTDGGTDSTTSTGTLQHSGTRIKLQGTLTPEGTFVFGGAYDTKLDTPCYPYPTEDGVLHCIPSVATYVGNFSDDQCTTPVAQTSKATCDTPKFAARSVTGATPCDIKDSIFKLGAKTTPAKLFFKNGAACMEGAVDANSDYYAVGSAVPASDLVAFKSVEVAVTPSLRAVVVDGDDGSRLQRTALIDVARNKPCDIHRAGDDKTRCTPRSSANTGGSFTENTCGTRAATKAMCEVSYELFDDTTASTFEERRGCTLSKTRTFPIGAMRATREQFTVDRDGGCNGPSTGFQDLFDVGPEIAPSTLPEIVETATTGRIVEQTYSVAGTTIRHTGELTDTMLKVRCRYRKGPDGLLRCFPSGIGASFYSDDKCTVPLGVTSDACDLQNAKYIAVEQGATCAKSAHIFAIGKTLDPTTPTWLKGSDGMCNAVGGSSALAFYTLGAELPTSTFAAGTTTMR